MRGMAGDSLAGPQDASTVPAWPIAAVLKVHGKHAVRLTHDKITFNPVAKNPRP